MFNRFKLRTLISVVFTTGTMIAVLTQSIGCNHGVGKAINDVRELDEEIEKRNQEIEKALSQEQ